MNIAFLSRLKWVFHGLQIHQSPPVSRVLNGLNPPSLRACLHGSGRHLGGEVTRLGGLTCRGGLPGLLGKVTLSAGV